MGLAAICDSVLHFGEAQRLEIWPQHGSAPKKKTELPDAIARPAASSENSSADALMFAPALCPDHNEYAKVPQQIQGAISRLAQPSRPTLR